MSYDPGVRRAIVWVPGHPRTKGSLDAQVRRDGSVRLVDTPQSKRWRRDVTLALRDAVKSGRAAIVVDCAVIVHMVFYVPYPPTHAWAGDLDKLERNVLDAMTGTVITDDRYVVKIDSCKLGAAGTHHGPGVLVEVWELAG